MSLSILNLSLSLFFPEISVLFSCCLDMRGGGGGGGSVVALSNLQIHLSGISCLLCLKILAMSPLITLPLKIYIWH